MKTMMLVFAAALGLGVSSAYASEDVAIANTQFTEMPGVIAQAPAQNSGSVVVAQPGQAVPVYVTQSRQGTWLFAPAENGNG